MHEGGENLAARLASSTGRHAPTTRISLSFNLRGRYHLDRRKSKEVSSQATGTMSKALPSPTRLLRRLDGILDPSLDIVASLFSAAEMRAILTRLGLQRAARLQTTKVGLAAAVLELVRSGRVDVQHGPSESEQVDGFVEDRYAAQAQPDWGGSMSMPEHRPVDDAMALGGDSEWSDASLDDDLAVDGSGADSLRGPSFAPLAMTAASRVPTSGTRSRDPLPRLPDSSCHEPAPQARQTLERACRVVPAHQQAAPARSLAASRGKQGSVTGALTAPQLLRNYDLTLDLDRPYNNGTRVCLTDSESSSSGDELGGRQFGPGDSSGVSCFAKAGTGDQSAGVRRSTLKRRDALHLRLAVLGGATVVPIVASPPHSRPQGDSLSATKRKRGSSKSPLDISLVATEATSAALDPAPSVRVFSSSLAVERTTGVRRRQVARPRALSAVRVPDSRQPASLRHPSRMLKDSETRILPSSTPVQTGNDGMRRPMTDRNADHSPLRGESPPWIVRQSTDESAETTPWSPLKGSALQPGGDGRFDVTPPQVAGDGCDALNASSDSPAATAPVSTSCSVLHVDALEAASELPPASAEPASAVLAPLTSALPAWMLEDDVPAGPVEVKLPVSPASRVEAAQGTLQAPKRPAAVAAVGGGVSALQYVNMRPSPRSVPLPFSRTWALHGQGSTASGAARPTSARPGLAAKTSDNSSSGGSSGALRQGRLAAAAMAARFGHAPRR